MNQLNEILNIPIKYDMYTEFILKNYFNNNAIAILKIIELHYSMIFCFREFHST